MLYKRTIEKGATAKIENKRVIRIERLFRYTVENRPDHYISVVQVSKRSPISHLRRLQIHSRVFSVTFWRLPSRS